MNFSKLRHRIIFLKQNGSLVNSMGEEIPKYEPFKPSLKNNLFILDGKVYLKTDERGNAILIITENGMPMAHELSLSEYYVAASIEPMTGREYLESQKIRAETTYKITTRYFPNISADMRLLYKDRELEIHSVLNVGERNVELQLICSEVMQNAE